MPFIASRQLLLRSSIGRHQQKGFFFSKKRISTSHFFASNEIFRKINTKEKVWAAALASSSVAILAFWMYSASLSITKLDSINDGIKTKRSDDFKVEINFMEKLAAKPYLQPQSSLLSQKSNQKNAGISSNSRVVPSTLRILTVDLPEVAEHGFRDGTCRIATDYIFPDDIAKPLYVQLNVSNRNRKRGRNKSNKDIRRQQSQVKLDEPQHNITLEIEQKAWAKAMFHCYHNSAQDRVGVEILETSMEALNERNLQRKTPAFLVATKQRQQSKKEEEKEQQQSQDGTVSDSSGKKEESLEKQPTTNNMVQSSFSIDDELEAPWNQKAWISEMNLRISGNVEYFGAPMEPASKWRRWIWGDVYRAEKSSAANQHKWSSSRHARKLTERTVTDGQQNEPFTSMTNATEQNDSKPHAVIANGSALQKVPHSLKLLQRACREHHVPLFILYDPRVKWGANTHATLSDVMKDLRKTVKLHLIQMAQHQDQHFKYYYYSFRQGRWIGKAETEAKWQAKELLRQTQEAMKRAEDYESWKQRELVDWKEIDADSLERKLIKRGLIRRDGKNFEYETALIALSKQIQKNIEKNEKPSETFTDTGAKDVNDAKSENVTQGK